MFIYVIFFAISNMSKLHMNTKKSADMFELLKQMQSHLTDFKTLEIFTLPKPVCLQNEYTINMFYLSNKWPEEFPDLQIIKRSIKDDSKLFYMPQEDYYYLYYHLLIAYKNFLKSGKKDIYDDETPLDYEKFSEYLIRKNLNATKFFEVYLQKGQNLSDSDLVHATIKEVDEVTNDKFDEKFIPRKMTTEPTMTLPLESTEIKKMSSEPELESEIEIPKTISPLPSQQFEIEIENYPEAKVKLEIEEV